MDFKKIVTLAVFTTLVVVVTFFAYAEEPVTLEADATVVSSDQALTFKNIDETQWAWGEVTNLDEQAKTFTLKYLDYETDQEKELVLAVDEKTTFENIKRLDELKLKDTLSVDYMAGADGKNTAKNINFERSDSSAVPVVPAEENTQPAEVAAVEPVTDTLTPVSIPATVEVPALVPVVETPAPIAEVAASTDPVVTEAPALPPVEVTIPLDGESTAQPTTAVESPVPAAQEGQAQ